MPCNPAIGGPAKSHLVKEIDALGGIMGLAADATYLQLKTLNISKGPAVRALRAQSDKHAYSAWVRQYLENCANLTIYQSSAKEIIFTEKSGEIFAAGIRTNLDEEICAKAIVLTAGTFLEGRIFTGKKFESAGRAGEKATHGISASISSFGLETKRLKTGTPPRIDKRSIDFSELEVAHGDQGLGLTRTFFSFLPYRPQLAEHPCFITRTNEKTHEVIRENLLESPMYSGELDSVGPRYCPSIEDKVVRFPHNPSHHFFLEPEGLSSNEFYLQGCSTSLPIEVQWKIVHSLPGLSEAVITRPAYAVEYDCFPGVQFKHNFESKNISSLFVSGQVLGTSGYEEAAAQGLMAGINAAIKAVQMGANGNRALNDYAKQKNDFVLGRSESYIGTLVDDLVTKEINEPYRMLTSRSEYRLLLRQDNADRRLTGYGRELGLVDDFRWQVFNQKVEQLNKEIKYFSQVRIETKSLAAKFKEAGDSEKAQKFISKSGDKVLLADLLRRPDLSFEELKEYIHYSLSPDQIRKLKAKDTWIDSLEHGYELETEIKYEGYISREHRLIKEMEKYEKVKVPQDFDFLNCQQISLEAREKLAKVAPKNLAQAARVGGVTPNDVSVLSILFAARKRDLATSASSRA